MPLIRLFFDIALFRLGPQDCPASTFLLWLALAANLAVGVLLALLDPDWLDALARSVIGALMLAAFLGAALYLSGKMSRFLQTATAAFGCDTLVSVLAIPFLVGAQWSPEAAGILLLLLMAWQIAVIGHILRHALSIALPTAVGLALAYTAVSYRIIMELFPAPPLN